MPIVKKDLDKMIPGHTPEFAAAEAADNSRDVVGPIGSAITSEEETIVFYKDLLDMFPDFEPVLQDIIGEEEKHIGQLQVLRDNSSEQMKSNIEKGVEEAEHQLETGSSEEPDDLGEAEAEVEVDDIAIEIPEDDTIETVSKGEIPTEGDFKEYSDKADIEAASAEIESEDDKSHYIDDILNEDVSKKKWIYQGPIYDDYGMVVRDGYEWVHADDKQTAIKELIKRLKKAYKSSHIHIEPQNVKEVSTESVNEDYDDDYYDDWEESNIYGGDMTYCPICDTKLTYSEDGDSYCPDCGESAFWLAQKRREMDKVDEDFEAASFGGFDDDEIAAMRDEQREKEAMAARKASNPEVKPGDRIRIIKMDGEPHYDGKEGEVDYIDSIGQIHGTWGGLAVVPEVDIYELITNESKNISALKESFSKILNEDLNSSYKPMLNNAVAAEFITNIKDFAEQCIQSADIRTFAYICRVAILKATYDAKAWWQNKSGEIMPIDVTKGAGTIGITKGSDAKLDFTIGDSQEVYYFTQNNAVVKLINPVTKQEDTNLLKTIKVIKKWYEYVFLRVVEPEKLEKRIKQRQQTFKAELASAAELDLDASVNIDRWYALGWLAQNVTKIFAIIPERGDFESIFLSFNPEAQEDIGYTIKPDGLTSGGFPNLYTYMFLVHFKRSAIQKAPAGVIDYLSRFGSQVKNPMSCNRLALNLVNNYGFNFGDIDNDSVYNTCLKMVPGAEERKNFNAGFGIVPEDPIEQDPDFGNIDSLEDDMIGTDNTDSGSVEESLNEANQTANKTFTLHYDRLSTLDFITEKPTSAPYDYVCDLDDLVDDFIAYDLFADVTQAEADQIVAILGITEDKYYNMNVKDLHKLLAEHFSEIYEIAKEMLLSFYREDAEDASISEVLDDGEDISDEDDDWDDDWDD